MLWIITQIATHPCLSEYVIRECTEASFDAALVTAKDNDSIRFECDKPLKITTPKVIRQSITLDGNNVQLLFEGQLDRTVIEIASGVTVTVNRFIFDTNFQVRSWINNRGTLNVNKCIFRHGELAIANVEGVVQIHDTLLEHNHHGLNNDGRLAIERVVFRNNSGTAVYNSETANIADSLFIGNAHGIDNGGGVVLVTNSYFHRNKVRRSATVGAGIASSGKAYVVNSVLTENEAEGGAGLFNRQNGYLLILHTLLANNPKSNCRGGIWDGGGNIQYPLRTCGKSVRVEPNLKFIQPVWNNQ